MSASDDPARGRGAIIAELGLVTHMDGDLLRGDAPVVPELCYPGTTVPRMSVLLTWADIVAGLAAAHTMTPRISVTLDLDVHLFRQPVGAGDIEAVATIIKAGRTVVVSEVTLHHDGAASPFGLAHASFMASPNPAHEFPGGFPSVMQERFRLSAPLAERADVRWLAAGIAEMPRSEEGLNGVGNIQGGLVALAAEEAVRSARPEEVLVSLDLRYLRPFRNGPAYAVANVEHDLAHVRITEGAPDGKLGAVATARVAAPDG